MQRIDDYPGLRTEPGLFERAYELDGGQVVRVRFVPQQVDPALAGELSGPVAPVSTGVRISVSFVDDEGQVEQVGPGRYLVAEGEAHSWQSDSGVPFEAETWLEAQSATAIGRAVAWAATQRAAAAAGLLAPPPGPPPAPAPLSPALSEGSET